MHLPDLFPHARHQQLHELLAQKQAWINQEKKGFLRYRIPLQELSHLRATWCDFSGDVVRIGTPSDIASSDRERLQVVLRGLMPWRKGPFSVFGIDIDAEWRSDRKWNRLIPEIPDLSGKIIADIGSNNGYYMFRMAYHRPALVLGFEPYVHHYFTFTLLNGFAGQSNLQSTLLGIEHLPLFPESFDVIFCMGILYHRPSPIAALQELLAALKPGGWLILESQAIPGNDPVALFPEHTYAKVPGTWFVPTATCLRHWLTRTGFREVHCFCEHAMSSMEQRRTPWMEFESFQDFIDKDNPGLTIEGYPVPRRVFFKATK
ncbi:tRNA 5-methoxyuridine(34)/uridine 5-oxyacetic acid(34) synthase CmoB [Desulfobulbus propionicus]